MDRVRFWMEGCLFSSSPDHPGNQEQDSESTSEKTHYLEIVSFPLHAVLIIIGHNISSQDQSNCQNSVFFLQCNFTFSVNV